MLFVTKSPDSVSMKTWRHTKEPVTCPHMLRHYKYEAAEIYEYYIFLYLY